MHKFSLFFHDMPAELIQSTCAYMTSEQLYRQISLTSQTLRTFALLELISRIDDESLYYSQHLDLEGLVKKHPKDMNHIKNKIWQQISCPTSDIVHKINGLHWLSRIEGKKISYLQEEKLKMLVSILLSTQIISIRENPTYNALAVLAVQNDVRLCDSFELSHNFYEHSGKNFILKSCFKRMNSQEKIEALEQVFCFFENRHDPYNRRQALEQLGTILPYLNAAQATEVLNKVIALDATYPDQFPMVYFLTKIRAPFGHHLTPEHLDYIFSVLQNRIQIKGRLVQYKSAALKTLSYVYRVVSETQKQAILESAIDCLSEWELFGCQNTQILLSTILNQSSFDQLENLYTQATTMLNEENTLYTGLSLFCLLAPHYADSSKRQNMHLIAKNYMNAKPDCIYLEMDNHEIICCTHLSQVYLIALKLLSRTAQAHQQDDINKIVETSLQILSEEDETNQVTAFDALTYVAPHATKEQCETIVSCVYPMLDCNPFIISFHNSSENVSLALNLLIQCITLYPQIIPESSQTSTVCYDVFYSFCQEIAPKKEVKNTSNSDEEPKQLKI